MPSSDVERLFEHCLVADYDDEAPWNAVHELRAIGTREVFDQAARWCESTEPLRRARGMDILAQLGRSIGQSENSFPDESLSVVSRTLEVEADEQVLSSGIHALGHIGNAISVPLIARWVAHDSSEVRFAVACALGSFPDDPGSISKLVVLTRDPDEDVRDWATFGLGVQGDLDTPEIRDALWERISDPFEDARMEAFIGLGKRKDHRIAPLLLSVFGESEVAEGYVEATELLLGLDSSTCRDWDVSDYVRKLRAICSERG